MSAGNGNGVIRIGRKGLKKFAIGEGDPFEFDVVQAFDHWIIIDESFREGQTPDEDGARNIPLGQLPEYRQAQVSFVTQLAQDHGAELTQPLTIAEAAEFIARLRECYDDLVVFFRPKPSQERGSPATSAAVLEFSEEPSTKAETTEAGRPS